MKANIKKWNKESFGNIFQDIRLYSVRSEAEPGSRGEYGIFGGAKDPRKGLVTGIKPKRRKGGSLLEPEGKGQMAHRRGKQH